MATITETVTSPTNSFALKPTPEVPILPHTASVDEILEGLKVAGGCVIKQLMSPEALDQIDKDVRPDLEVDTAWTGSFFPPQTRRSYALLGKSETAAKKLVMHPIYQGVANKLLTEKNWFWEGSNKRWAVSRPQLSNTIVFSIRPGAAAQPLHRDDSVHQQAFKAVNKYPDDLKRDTGLGFFVAGKKATKANGATRFIPGSHLWAHEQPPDESLCQYAELERGDGFLMLASCLHGGSANMTKDEERLIFSSFMTKGYLRQEENQYLAVSQEKMKKLPVEIQKVAGYSLSEPFLGWVNSTDPRLVLDPNVQGNEDMWSKEEFVE